MKEMVKHVPDAGSYAPVTILVDERADGLHVSYDRMVSPLAPYRNPDALTVARDLDTKVETLLAKAANLTSLCWTVPCLTTLSRQFGEKLPGELYARCRSFLFALHCYVQKTDDERTDHSAAEGRML